MNNFLDEENVLGQSCILSIWTSLKLLSMLPKRNLLSKTENKRNNEEILRQVQCSRLLLLKEVLD